MKPEPVRFALSTCQLREFRKGDEPSLVRHANNRNVWKNLRDAFPFPYKSADARHWIRLATSNGLNYVFAIDVDGFAVGAIGLHPGIDVHRHSVEIGYWLSEEYWNRGICTEAVQVVTNYAFTTLGMSRVHAEVFHWNTASMRVLEKAGFAREGLLKKSAFKDNQWVDEVVFARTTPGP
jgi:ribosomal-protein-alanine N-acetyltransferase